MDTKLHFKYTCYLMLMYIIDIPIVEWYESTVKEASDFKKSYPINFPRKSSWTFWQEFKLD